MFISKAEKLNMYKNEMYLLQEANDIKELMKSEFKIEVTIEDVLLVLKMSML
jgi:hypothetical protein